MKNAEKLILEAGLRPTKARIAELATISHTTAALNHADIMNVLEGNKKFDRVTIYRVLDWLHEHQLVHKILTDNRSWKFQSNTQNNTQQYKPTSAKKSLITVMRMPICNASGAVRLFVSMTSIP
jgi:Fur family ferric uptake transcriptional regulator